jgi:hypothetical protein
MLTITTKYQFPLSIPVALNISQQGATAFAQIPEMKSQSSLRRVRGAGVGGDAADCTLQLSPQAGRTAVKGLMLLA